jgi:hypothetical protein
MLLINIFWVACYTIVSAGDIENRLIENRLGEGVPVRRLLNNPVIRSDQDLGTVSISLAVQFDINNNPSHAGIIVTGYGYATKSRTAAPCCSTQPKVVEEGFPPVIPENEDYPRTSFAVNSDLNGIWAIGFHLMPKNLGAPLLQRVCCAEGEVKLWDYSDIAQIVSGASVEGYFYRLPYTVEVLYEDAKVLIRRGLKAVTNQVPTCYHLFSGPFSLIGHNCGSFSVMLMRKANIPVPHIGDCFDIICPCRTSTLQSCQRRTDVATRRYRNEHELRLRKGGDGLTLCNRIQRTIF